MAGDTVRLFVAIPIDDVIRKAMRRIDWWVDHLERFRKVPPKNRHVTVAFLGDVPVSATNDIEAAMDRALADRPAFAMPIIGMASMPNERRQRALAVALDASTGFAELAHAARTELLTTPALARLLEEPERAPRPHITVARKKRIGGGGRVDVSDAPAWTGALPCSNVALVRSELAPQGPIYTVLRGWTLCGSSGC